LLHDLDEALGYSDEDMEEDGGLAGFARVAANMRAAGAGNGDGARAFMGRGRALGGRLGQDVGRLSDLGMDLGMGSDMDLDGFDSEGLRSGYGMQNRAGGGNRVAAAALGGAAAGGGGGGGGVPGRRGRPSSTPLSAGGGGVEGPVAPGSARSQVLRGLLPRVPAAKRPEPMCAQDKGCDQCASLQRFLGNPRALELPMVLNKKQQMHVQKVVAWLVAPEGGAHGLQCGEPVGEEGLSSQGGKVILGLMPRAGQGQGDVVFFWQEDMTRKCADGDVSWRNVDGVRHCCLESWRMSTLQTRVRSLCT
jgi:hypothetical protein